MAIAACKPSSSSDKRGSPEKSKEGRIDFYDENDQLVGSKVLDHCNSGQTYSFYGVDLYTRGDPELEVRVWETPGGAQRSVQLRLLYAAGQKDLGEFCVDCAAGPRVPRKNPQFRSYQVDHDKETRQELCKLDQYTFENQNKTMNEVWYKDLQIQVGCPISPRLSLSSGKEAARFVLKAHFSECF